MFSSASSAFSGLLGDIADEIQTFEAEKEDKLEELEKYTELITEPDLDAINLLEAQAYSTTLYQSTNTPEEFYDLTIHMGNPGVLSLSVPMTYCDIALILPKPATPI